MRVPTPIAFTHRDRYIDLGLRIAFYRKRKGLSQEQLAEMAGLSRTHLANIEAPNKVQSFSLEALFNIADALDMPTSKLLEFQ